MLTPLGPIKIFWPHSQSTEHLATKRPWTGDSLQVMLKRGGYSCGEVSLLWQRGFLQRKKVGPKGCGVVLTVELGERLPIRGSYATLLQLSHNLTDWLMMPDMGGRGSLNLLYGIPSGP